MKNKKWRIILLGAPGAGKGTQAALLSQKLGLAHIASGDLFRKAQNEGTKLGLLAKSYMEKGLLVPDEVTIQMILGRIASEEGFILDGFPRTVEQAKALDKALANNKVIDKAIYIKVSFSELLRRLTERWICRQCQTPYHLITSPPKLAGRCDNCGSELYQRPDDAMEAVQRRLEVYFAQTLPVINYYQQQGKLLEVNGDQGIKEINEELLALLQEK